MKIKDNHGVTLISLIVMVVIISILAGISINYGLTQRDDMTDGALSSELQMVQHIVLERYAKYKLTNDEDILYISEATLVKNSEIDELKQKGYKLLVDTETLNFETDKHEKFYYVLSLSLLKKIGITNAKNEYIVNYSSGEVINKTKKALSTGELLYINNE